MSGFIIRTLILHAGLAVIAAWAWFIPTLLDRYPSALPLRVAVPAGLVLAACAIADALLRRHAKPVLLRWFSLIPAFLALAGWGSWLLLGSDAHNIAGIAAPVFGMFLTTVAAVICAVLLIRR